MSLTVKLPDKKKKDEYSLYVSSKITYLKSFKDLGTLIICETICCVFNLQKRGFSLKLVR